MGRKYVFIVLLFALALSGCAMGNKINYTGKTGIKPIYNPDIPILIICQDKRPYVLNGDKKPNFVGLTRSLYGIPYGTTTTSGKPLADDFAGLLTTTFNEEHKDKNVSSISVAPNSTDDEILDIIKKATPGNGAALLYSIYEWKTDTHITMSLHYNVKLSVYNQNGDIIKDKSVQGIDKLGNDEREERKSLANAVNDVFGSLLNSDTIISAINVASNNTPREKVVKVVQDQDVDGDCSVEKILKMKEIGMTDNQIKSACMKE